MLRVLAILFTAAAAVTPVVTEVTRNIVHKRRERVNGLGGTQDIAMWGTFIGFGLGLLAAGCWIAWFSLGS